MVAFDGCPVPVRPPRLRHHRPTPTLQTLCVRPSVRPAQWETLALRGARPGLPRTYNVAGAAAG